MVHPGAGRGSGEAKSIWWCVSQRVQVMAPYSADYPKAFQQWFSACSVHFPRKIGLGWSGHHPSHGHLQVQIGAV